MKNIIILIFILGISLSSCKKFLEVDAPNTKVDVSAVFASDAGAISLVNGIYSRAADASWVFPRLSMHTGLSADELVSYFQETDGYYRNALNSVNYRDYWAELYNYIYAANQVIEGLEGPNNVSQPVRTRLLGEAKFLRAYFYFHLVNLFGDVPLVTTTAYLNNFGIGRTPTAQIYLQMVSDLTAAQELLGTGYTQADLVTTTSDRLRPNRWAAAALLARVNLFRGDYSTALALSDSVISQSGTYSLEPLDNVFLSQSRETIFALQPANINSNTWEGNAYILVMSPATSSRVSLSSQLYASFEPGDLRRDQWIGSFSASPSERYYFAHKYKVRDQGAGAIPLEENEVKLRLAEQYLIRAEAKIMTGRIASGIQDINFLRARARASATAAIPNPLPDLDPSMPLQQALLAVEQERKTELFTENGDRWFTLKRMGSTIDPASSRADQIMPAITQQKGGTWRPSAKLYPIPATELRKDLTLTQNPGYN